MSLEFVVLVVVLVLAVFYLRRRQPSREKPLPTATPEVPRGYRFHFGHTWMAEQGRDVARAGIDSFAAHLLGNVERVALIGEQRWVRQGQKLMTLNCQGGSIEMMSPLEGVITAVNPEVLARPALLADDPYQSGWVCAIKSPELDTNVRNLLQGEMAANWMQNSFTRLKTMLAGVDPALAQDGGLPQRGLLGNVSPELFRAIIKEFFLN